jgi:hypothetical protein
VKRKAQQVDVHVVQERRQPDRLIPPCGATYAVHAWDTLAQLWVWCVLLRTALPLALPLPSTASAAMNAASPSGSDFHRPCIIRLGRSALDWGVPPCRCGPRGRTSPSGQPVDLPVPAASTRGEIGAWDCAAGQASFA